MGEGQRTDVGVTEAPAASRTSVVLWALLALLVDLGMFDAAVETFRSGSPLRWWLSPTLVVLAAGGVWLWRPGGRLLRRFGPAYAAGTAALTLLAVLAVTAWLPAGQEAGLTLLLQPTSRVLAVVLALAVLLASLVLFRAAYRLGRTPRLLVMALTAALGLYALASLGLAVREGLPFAALWNGSALWQRLPRWLQGTFIAAVVLLPASIVVQLVFLAGIVRRRQPLGVLVHQSTALTMALVMAVSGFRLAPARSVVRGHGQVVASAFADYVGGAPATWPPPQDQFDRLFRALEGMVGDIPTDSFTPRAVLAATGTDPAKIVAWVTQNTAWVPYRGVLRGPVGVLMDRAGNTLDRALLLADILREAGAEVRLARAAVSPAEALEAWRTLTSIQAAGVSPSTASAFDAEAIKKYAIDRGLDPAIVLGAGARMALRWERLLDDLRTRVSSQAPFLVSAVADLRPPDPHEAKVLAALSDHWWVERRVANEWVAEDLVFPSRHGNAGALAAEQTFSYNQAGGKVPLPSQWCHEVDIRVIVQQSRSGKRAERTPLAYTFRPAELIGQPIALRHSPLHSSGLVKSLDDAKPLEALKAAFVSEREWLPYLLVGGKTIKQSSFTADGELREKPGQADQGSGGLFGGFGALAGGAVESAQAGGELTAEWVEYEIRVPGEKSRKVRREIFDLGGPESQAPQASLNEQQRLQRGVHLSESIEILPLVSRLSIPFVTHQVIRFLMANRGAMADLFAKAGADDKRGLFEAAARMQPLGGRLFDLALARHCWGPGAEAVYLDTPNLLTYRSALTATASGDLVLRRGYDLVANGVGARAKAPADRFRLAVAQGTADTNAEALLAADGDVVNAGAALATIGGSREAWVTVQRSDDAEWTRVGGDPGLRARIERDLNDGCVVIVPRTLGRSTREQSRTWWRIDPTTGRTLGIGPLGWGQAMTERTKVGWMAIVGIAFFLGDTAWCISRGKATKDCLCQGGQVGAGAGVGVTGLPGMALASPGLMVVVWVAGAVTVALIGNECAPDATDSDKNKGKSPFNPK